MSETIQSTATRVEDVPVKKERRFSKKTLIAVGVGAAAVAASVVAVVKASKENDEPIETVDAPELVLIDGISDLTA